MSEWQPIETAPKDGTEIWVKGNFKSKSAYYDYDCDVWFGDEFCLGSGTNCESCLSCDGYINPTHWKPMEETK